MDIDLYGSIWVGNGHDDKTSMNQERESILNMIKNDLREQSRTCKHLQSYSNKGAET